MGRSPGLGAWFFGTTIAFDPFTLANKASERGRHMGNRMFWAFLWVIGIPLPILFILYMLFGGGT